MVQYVLDEVWFPVSFSFSARYKQNVPCWFLSISEKAGFFSHLWCDFSEFKLTESKSTSSNRLTEGVSRFPFLEYTECIVNIIIEAEPSVINKWMPRGMPESPTQNVTMIKERRREVWECVSLGFTFYEMATVWHHQHIDSNINVKKMLWNFKWKIWIWIGTGHSIQTGSRFYCR